MGEASRPRGALLAASAMTLTVLLTACGTDAGNEPEPLSSQDVGTPWEVPDMDLVDTSGEDFTVTADTRKSVTLVFFGYTNCPDICKMVMANLASAMTRLDDEQRDRVEVVFVTTDPARDTPETLRTYLDRFDPAFVGLTGELERILQLGAAFKIPIEQGEELASGGYDVMHGDQIFLVDEDDTIPMYWSRDTSSATFARDISTLLEGHA